MLELSLDAAPAVQPFDSSQLSRTTSAIASATMAVHNAKSIMVPSSLRRLGNPALVLRQCLDQTALQRFRGSGRVTARRISFEESTVSFERALRGSAQPNAQAEQLLELALTPYGFCGLGCERRLTTTMQQIVTVQCSCDLQDCLQPGHHQSRRCQSKAAAHGALGIPNNWRAIEGAPLCPDCVRQREQWAVRQRNDQLNRDAPPIDPDLDVYEV